MAAVSVFYPEDVDPATDSSMPGSVSWPAMQIVWGFVRAVQARVFSKVVHSIPRKAMHHALGQGETWTTRHHT